MHPADKAVLRLAIGMALAVLIAYGFALPGPFVACLMTVLLLCKPGPPIPFLKGVVLALVIGGLLVSGLLMVPILENYAVTGVLLTGVLFYAVYFLGTLKAGPLATILVVAFAAMPVAGVAEQALVPRFSTAMAVGLGIGVLVSGISHSFFPDDPAAARKAASPGAVTRETARRTALQATVVVMPVFVLALTNPAFYLPAIMKAGALGQQASSTNSRSAGRELVGSTLMGAGLALFAWFGLSMWPTLWMLMLWLVLATFWVGKRLFGVKATALPASFWSNAVVTMLILLGPAIEDTANGKDVLTASLTRFCLFVAAALYAWATVWALERWRAL